MGDRSQRGPRTPGTRPTEGGVQPDAGKRPLVQRKAVQRKQAPWPAVQRKADAYQWPEEVERLCAPDADLSGYDTTPVKSRTDVYYVYRGMDQGIVFVDANGKPVHGLRR